MAPTSHNPFKIIGNFFAPPSPRSHQFNFGTDGYQLSLHVQKLNSRTAQGILTHVLNSLESMHGKEVGFVISTYSRKKLSEKCLSILVKTLNCIPHISALSTTLCMHEDSEVATLLQSLAERPLTRFTLVSDQVGPFSTQFLSQILSQHTLTAFGLHTNHPISHHNFINLGEALKSAPSLASLGVARAEGLDEGHMVVLSEVLHHNTCITELELSGNPIPHLYILTGALKTNRTLQRLSILNTHLNSTQTAELAQGIGSCSLMELRLTGNEMGDAGAETFGSALATNTSLTELELDFNGIGPEGTEKIAEGLHTNSSLSVLNLCFNEIQDRGAVSLAKSLSLNHHLTALQLNCTHIGPEGAAALAEAMKSNSSLQTLGLKYNRIENAGVSAFAEALHVNTSLTDLDLQGDAISAEGILPILTALKTNNSLTRINLSGNALHAQDAQQLLTPLREAFQTNTALISCGLEDTPEVRALTDRNRHNAERRGQSLTAILTQHLWLKYPHLCQ